MTQTYKLIYETIHGSQAYGLARPGSDLDLKGVIVGPKTWYMGFVGGPEQIEESPDHVRFELRKFFRLAAESNPTLIELLWTEPEDHKVLTELGQRLLDSRELFLSKRVAQSFGGYALSQLKRIKTHRRWLLKPPKKEPLRADFGLPNRTVVSKDQLGAADTLVQQERLMEVDLSPNFLELLDRERRYRQARKEWEQHRLWLKNRNSARAELEARFGYDTKHAMHLVRLLRMGVEILTSGQVNVKRPDRDELLAIRDGALKYDELLEQAESLSLKIKEAEKASALPENPDKEVLEELCCSIIEKELK